MYKIPIFLCILFICSGGNGEKVEKDNASSTWNNLKDLFLKDGFPRLSYYDLAEFTDKIILTFYSDLNSKIQTTELDRSTFTELGKELFTQNLAGALLSTQTLYTKSLDAFDRILDILGKLRKEQKEADLGTGQAFLDMYKAVTEMDVKEDETFIGILAAFWESIAQMNQNSVKTMYKLAKKHKDLQAFMEIHENATEELKNLCLKYAKLADLPVERLKILAEKAEPVVTLVMLGQWFAALT